ncbi:MAG: hypothetical protein NZV14_12910 [Bryobacteraceae bacterium]|nr:hypothetical protein [Bryobacteraceae bacterium]MDW8379056.1 hypothetical protein [Bryobacterales bacterium]
MMRMETKMPAIHKHPVLARLRRAEQGQDLIEYALLAAMISLVIWALVPYTGYLDSLSHIWNRVHCVLIVYGGG